MRRDEAKEKLRRFITAELMGIADYPLTDSDALVSGGLIDSFSLVHIAVFLEREFGVFVPESELTADDFDTIEQIAARVERG